MRRMRDNIELTFQVKVVMGRIFPDPKAYRIV